MINADENLKVFLSGSQTFYDLYKRSLALINVLSEFQYAPNVYAYIEIYKGFKLVGKYY